MKSNIFSRFKEDERGTATIESLLWMPLFFYLFIFITDVSFVFFGKTQALSIAQDGTRNLSVGAYTIGSFNSEALKDEASILAAKTDVQNKIQALSPSATVDIAYVLDGNTGAATQGTVIETDVALQISELTAIGSIPNFASGTIEFTVRHFKEY